MKKTPAKKTPTRAPARNDKADVRCAFVDVHRSRSHDLGKTPEEQWCFGCGFYVCEACDETQPMGSHDVMEHVSLEDDE